MVYLKICIEQPTGKEKDNPHILEIPANDIYDLIITFLTLKIIHSWKRRRGDNGGSW